MIVLSVLLWIPLLSNLSETNPTLNANDHILADCYTK